MFLLPTWFILAILTGISSNAFNFFGRYILRGDEDETVFAWYFEFLRFLFFGFLAFYNWHLVINTKSVILYILLGLTEFISIYWYMKMHSYNDLSVSSIISRTRMIWIPILSFIFLSEALKSSDYVGIAIVFLGVTMISVPKKLFVDKGVFYANSSAFVIAINIIICVMLLPYGSNSVILAACALPSVILFPLLMRDSKQRMKSFFKRNIFMKTFAISFNVLTVFLLMASLRFGNASKVNAVYQGMLILSVIAGIIFLRERENILKKLIGASITIAGVVLLSFS